MTGRIVRELLKPIRKRAGWTHQSLMEEYLDLKQLEEELEELYEEVTTKKETASVHTLLGRVKDTRRGVGNVLWKLAPYKGMLNKQPENQE
jgi:predicted nuclease with TOPRIM domain